MIGETYIVVVFGVALVSILLFCLKSKSSNKKLQHIDSIKYNKTDDIIKDAENGLLGINMQETLSSDKLHGKNLPIDLVDQSTETGLTNKVGENNPASAIKHNRTDPDGIPIATNQGFVGSKENVNQNCVDSTNLNKISGDTQENSNQDQSVVFSEDGKGNHNCDSPSLKEVIKGGIPTHSYDEVCLPDTVDQNGVGGKDQGLVCSEDAKENLHDRSPGFKVIKGGIPTDSYDEVYIPDTVGQSGVDDGNDNVNSLSNSDCSRDSGGYSSFDQVIETREDSATGDGDIKFNNNTVIVNDVTYAVSSKRKKSQDSDIKLENNNDKDVIVINDVTYAVSSKMKKKKEVISQETNGIIVQEEGDLGNSNSTDKNNIKSIKDINEHLGNEQTSDVKTPIYAKPIKDKTLTSRCESFDSDQTFPNMVTNEVYTASSFDKPYFSIKSINEICKDGENKMLKGLRFDENMQCQSGHVTKTDCESSNLVKDNQNVLHESNAQGKNTNLSTSAPNNNILEPTDLLDAIFRKENVVNNEQHIRKKEKKYYEEIDSVETDKESKPDDCKQDQTNQTLQVNICPQSFSNRSSRYSDNYEKMDILSEENDMNDEAIKSQEIYSQVDIEDNNLYEDEEDFKKYGVPSAATNTIKITDCPKSPPVIPLRNEVTPKKFDCPKSPPVIPLRNEVTPKKFELKSQVDTSDYEDEDIYENSDDDNNSGNTGDDDLYEDIYNQSNASINQQPGNGPANKRSSRMSGYSSGSNSDTTKRTTTTSEYYDHVELSEDSISTSSPTNRDTLTSIHADDSEDNSKLKPKQSSISLDNGDTEKSDQLKEEDNSDFDNDEDIYESYSNTMSKSDTDLSKTD